MKGRKKMSFENMEAWQSKYDADVNFRNAQLVMIEINKILWWEQMEKLMPMVAAELIKAGVKFPASPTQKGRS